MIAIVRAQPILRTQAMLSRQKRIRLLFQSLQTHSQIPFSTVFTVSCQQFPEWCLARRGRDWFRQVWPCVQSSVPS